jgi:hypothetical protein
MLSSHKFAFLLSICLIFTIIACDNTKNKKIAAQSELERKVGNEIGKLKYKVLYTSITDSIKVSTDSYKNDVLRYWLERAGLNSDGNFTAEAGHMENSIENIKKADSINNLFESGKFTDSMQLIRYSGKCTIWVSTCEGSKTMICKDSVEAAIYFKAYCNSNSNILELLVFDDIYKKK